MLVFSDPQTAYIILISVKGLMGMNGGAYSLYYHVHILHSLLYRLNRNGRGATVKWLTIQLPGQNYMALQA